MNSLRRLLLIVVASMALAKTACSVDDATTILIDDTVLVADCQRFGINLGGDKYHSGAALVKKRTTQNFEGVSYRQCHYGPFQDEQGAATWFSLSDTWQDILIGGRYTVLTGPAKGRSGTIVDVATRTAKHEGKTEEFSYFVFDQRVPAGPPNAGVLVEKLNLSEGQFRDRGGFWSSKNNRIEHGDVPPNSFGEAALVLDARQESAHARFSTIYQRYGQTNGIWRVRFWAKRLSGAASLRVGPDRWGSHQPVQLSDEWARRELTFTVSGVPEPQNFDDDPHLFFGFFARGGEVIVDDIEVWMEGDDNPTVFRDDCVQTLRKYNPGVLRFLQMGGNTLDNCLRPPLRAFSFTNQRRAKRGPYAPHAKTPYSLHEFYELCAHLGCEPWYCLPGTLSPAEVRQFMEYLAGPVDSEFGKLRAELGQTKPWTAVFPRIHVEFGNEAWNSAPPYQVGGFNGKDYWQDLITSAKGSSYYQPSIVFHAGGQAANAHLNRRIMRNAPAADRFAVAPYILPTLTRKTWEQFESDDDFFRWAFAWPIWRGRDGPMRENYELATDANLELSVYEVNHHTTRGDGPLMPRNRLVTSIAGGLNVVNTMLSQLKQFGARTQCLFSLAQHSYDAPGVGRVRLWGTALNMRQGATRYRPTFLACALANRVLGGDMVATRHSGLNPTFSGRGVFDRRRGVRTLRRLPCLYSYALREGQRRAAILINLDVAQAHPVRLQFSGSVAVDSAESWLLTAERITDNNEFETRRPQVEIKKQDLVSFNSPWKIEVPPFSMLVLSWQQQDDAAQESSHTSGSPTNDEAMASNASST